MFSIEGKFFKTLTKIGDFLILGILTLICSIPVVTIGASLTAMFYVGMKLVRNEEGYIVKDFFKSWRQNFKQSLLMELIIAALGIILVADIRICSVWAATEGSTFARLLMFLVIGVLLILAGVMLYAFPLLARFENTVLKTLKNALLLCVHHLSQTFVMLLATGALIYFSLGFYPVFILTVPFMCYVDSYVMARIMLQYMKPENTQSQETDYEDNSEISQ